MISPQRFLKLNPRHRMRKLAAALAEREAGEVLASGPLLDAGTARLLAAFLGAPDSGLEPSVRAAAEACYAQGAGLRDLNRLRHGLLDALGAPRAEWDLILRDRRTGAGNLEPEGRRVHPGMRAYLEDIRSPFNLGSIFRTAEAFGLERLILSPGCAEPEHPRARRSAMGCEGIVAWERLDEAGARERLSAAEGIFALETGGTPLDDFAFPERGLCLVGSEELGLSPEALAACAERRVSIPMGGSKASLNVGVAFGIIMGAWASFLEGRARGGGSGGSARTH